MSVFELDETHDAQRRSWVASAQSHADFPIQNLPYGIFVPADGVARPGVAIGDAILDLRAIASRLPEATRAALEHDTLNALFALPAATRRALRAAISTYLSQPQNAGDAARVLHEATACRLLLPARIGDYTDFYVGLHHATNVGRLFRPDNPLLPNYRHVPIGYHGRASSVRPSDVPVVRPHGQRKSPDGEFPLTGPSVRLDYELEMGVWIGGGDNALGETVPIASAADRIAGLCLLNDWSARDLQAWEYQPLGPFLAKSFHTTVSPWVVSAEALAPFRIAQPPRPDGDPAPLPYLWDEQDQARGAFAIELEVWLRSAKMREQNLPALRLSVGHATDMRHHMYWTVAQMVTHHASNGCDLHAGDLLGTGTISGPERDAFGSLIELTGGGKSAFDLPSGESRTFLQDGDEVTLRGHARREGYASIGFGDCRGVIVARRS